MGQADLDINRKARQVLVKHWIDLGNISLRSSSGRLTVRGNLQKIFGQTEELTAPVVELMFSEMRRIPGVKRLSAEIDNWTNAGGLWQPVSRGKDKKSHKPGSDEQKEAYVIDEE